MEIGDTAGEATNYVNLGVAFSFLGEYVKAKEYFEKALAISIEIRDRPGVATIYRNQGDLFRSLGENSRAKHYFEKALVIFMEIGDRAEEKHPYGLEP